MPVCMFTNQADSTLLGSEHMIRILVTGYPAIQKEKVTVRIYMLMPTIIQ